VTILGDVYLLENYNIKQVGVHALVIFRKLNEVSFIQEMRT
jgi:hypothetical protein